MKRRTLAATLSSVAALVGLSLAAAAPAQAQEAAGGYVALGDSYSSGVGAGDYDSDSGDCKRSANAYAQLWNAAHSPSSFDFTACSGAVTQDVIDGQLDPLDDSTSLVTISVGGNDAGFADAMVTCVTAGESACIERVQEARDYIQSNLSGQLDAVYDAIRAKAPDAQVVVLGYPRIYELDGDCTVGISEKSRAAVNEAANDLSTVLSARADAHGFDYGDVRDNFTGHEICSGDEWLHSVTLPIGDSYHPTAAGHSGGYLPALEALT